jgi:parallel beta-helix repeat protein
MDKDTQKNLLTSVLFGLAALVLLAAAPAHALTNVTACGQNLSTPGGQYILTADLDCTGTFATGIDITASKVVFHLAGHTIASTDCVMDKEVYGIFVHGGISGVRIDGGTVRGFTDGIVLSSSNSRVRGMTVTGACLFGIAVTGTGNQVDTSVISLTHGDGIGIGSGGSNRIVSNDISDNFRVGVDISNFSNDNFVANNIINRNGLGAGQQGGVAIFNGTGNVIATNSLNNNFEGIEIESPGNTATGNTVSGSLDVGIFIPGFGSPSVVKSNTVFGSVLVDMLDDQAACDSNTWRNNKFQTDLVNDVSDGGPKVGCLR